MNDVDSQQKLARLRKLYFRLEDACITEHNKQDRDDNWSKVLEEDGRVSLLLSCIVFAEAARRLAKLQEAQTVISPRNRIDDLFAQALKIRTAVDKCFLPVTDFEFEQCYSKGIFHHVIDELDKNEKLLCLFDERYAGYFYQYSAERNRQRALRRIQSANKKTSKEDLIAFTQLYTPDWTADYLLQNTLLTQWKTTESISNKDFKYFRESKQSASYGAKDLKILDPACGAGHILIRAFDLLHDMHTKEGANRAKAASYILRSSIYGCDLDVEALQMCALALVLKALVNGVEDLSFKLNLYAVSNKERLQDASAEFNSDDVQIESGSLHRAWTDNHALMQKYSAIVTNPPYIGRRLLDRNLKQFLKNHYPNAHHDLSAAFLARALELASSDGKVGFITQSSLLFLPSYGELRKIFIENKNLESVVELGTRVFPLAGGEKINSMLIVLSKSACANSDFLDLSNCKYKDDALQEACQYSKPLARENTDSPVFVSRICCDFETQRKFAFNYKCPQVLSNILEKCKKLQALADIKQGLATSDNERFVRFWWDVAQNEIGVRWHPYVKGAGSQRWYAPCQTVLDWGSDGSKIKEAVQNNYPYLNGKVAWVVKNERYYFRKGLTFSFVSTGNFAVRRMSEGSIFDVGGSALFCNDYEEDFLLGYLNSSFAAVCAKLLNPTFNFQVGDIKQIPLPEFDDLVKEQISMLSKEAFILKKSLSKYDETQLQFEDPSLNYSLETNNNLPTGIIPELLWQQIQKAQSNEIARLIQIELEIDELIIEAVSKQFVLSAVDKRAIHKLSVDLAIKRKPPQGHFHSKRDFAEYLLRVYLRQAQQSKVGMVCTELSAPFSEELTFQNALWIQEQLAMPLSSYFMKSFNKSQEKVFLGSPQQICLHPGESKLIFISLPHLRKAMNSALSLQNSGYKIIMPLIEQLSKSPDWRGKDLITHQDVLLTTTS